MIPLLLVESGPSDKEAYLREVARLAPGMTLLKNVDVRGTQNEWARNLLRSEDILDAPFRDEAQLMDIVQTWMRARGARRIASLTYQEEAVHVANALARRFGLTIIADDSSRVRNKGEMRAAWASIGIPQPRAELCQSFDSYVRAVETFAGQCVVKPVDMMGSCGVSRLRGCHADEMRSAWSDALGADFAEEDLRHAFGLSTDVIVEEFVEAAMEVSLEAVVCDGALAPVCFMEKALRDEIHFQEVGHVTPTRLGQEVQSLAVKYLRRAIRACGLRNSIVHAEFRVTPERDPVLIELGARLAGDRIPFVVQRSVGLSLFEIAIELASGLPVSLERRFEAQPAGVRFFRDAAERDAARRVARVMSSDWREHTERCGAQGYVEW